MKIAPVADMKAHFSAYLKTSKRTPVVVTRNGKPAAVLLGISDEDEIERLALAYSPKFARILAAAKRELAKGRGIPHEEFWEKAEGRRTEKPRASDA